ncbi:MAG: histidinol dehydrogenase, partial [Atribacteria sp.]|nr:histidinol dehydrogenase [Candidatus Atribacteria bacterium]
MIILKDIINKKKRVNKNRLEEIVNKIIGKVKNEDDKALIELTKIFDGVELDSLKVSKKEMKEAYNLVDKKTIES